MRVLVTGSRQVLNQQVVYQHLDLLWAQWFKDPARPQDDVLTIVHGGAPGADTLAGQWVWDSRDMAIARPPVAEVHPADWAKHGPILAGKIRNHEMVRLGADHVLAFLQVGAANAGTRHCIEEAERWLAWRGVPVEKVWVE